MLMNVFAVDFPPDSGIRFFAGCGIRWKIIRYAKEIRGRKKKLFLGYFDRYEIRSEFSMTRDVDFPFQMRKLGRTVTYSEFRSVSGFRGVHSANLFRFGNPQKLPESHDVIVLSSEINAPEDNERAPF